VIEWRDDLYGGDGDGDEGGDDDRSRHYECLVVRTDSRNNMKRSGRA